MWYQEYLIRFWGEADSPYEMNYLTWMSRYDPREKRIPISILFVFGTIPECWFRSNNSTWQAIRDTMLDILAYTFGSLCTSLRLARTYI